MRRFVRSLLIYTFAAVVIFNSLFPFYWAVNSSFKTSQDLFSTDFVPPHFTGSNYATILSEQGFLQSLWNSTVVASMTVVLSLLLALFSSFSLSRVRFKGRATLLLLILSVSMFPQVAVLSGMFELIRFLGLYNSLSGLAFCYLILVLPFTVWVMRGFMRSIPVELEEAAILDGCGVFRILFQVFLPLMKPAVVTTGLLSFIAAWNEFLFALTFTLSAEKRTVPVAISTLSGASQYELPWGIIMAASVLVTVPLLVLVLIFQKNIVSGLTAGAVKG